MTHSSKCLQAVGLAALVGLVATMAPSTSHATPRDRVSSLSIPMFGDRSEALWPIEVGLEIATLDGDLVVARRELVVAHGQHTTFAEVIASPIGSHAFELELVARHHAGGTIELEYDLFVSRAKFTSLTWTNYLMHRFTLAPRPEVGPKALAAARADIVETREQPDGPSHSQVVSVDGRQYEIRLYAASLRG